MTDEGQPPCLSAKGFRAVSGSGDPDREAEAEREENATASSLQMKLSTLYK